MKPIEVVTVKLDKERSFVLDMAALMRAERVMNKQRREDGLPAASIFSLIDEAVSGAKDGSMDVSAQFVGVLLWAGLSGDDPGLSVNDVAKMVRSPLAITATVFEAISRYFASRNEEEDGEAKSPLDQLNGTASVPSPGSN